MSNFTQLMNSAKLSTDRISLTVGDDWSQGRTVYGGMQAAIAVKAMRQQVAAELPLRSLQVTFIGPVPTGEVEASASLLRQGKSAAHVKAEIAQGTSTQMFALGIFGKDRESAAACDPRMQPTLSPGYAQEIKRSGGPAFFDNFDCRIIEGAPLFSGTEEASYKIYTRHRDDAACSYEHLAALADITPPLAFIQLTEPAFNSSMNWQLDFVRTPEQIAGTEWFRVDSEMVACDRGYSWQNASIWTDKGELVMLSRQCMAIFG